MKVIHDLGDGVFEVANVADLERAVRGFLAGKGIAADVRSEGDSVVVDYPDVSDIDADEDERIVVSFCQNGRFGKARKVAKEWIARVPWQTRAYRLLAQAEMETGLLDAASEHALDALRLDPKNVNALLLDGNIRTLKAGTMAGGLESYRRAHALCPDSPIALNNYAGALMHADGAGAEELERLFRRVIELDPSYRNAYLALSQVLGKKGDGRGAFDAVQTGLLKGVPRPEDTMPLMEEMRRSLVKLAAELSKGDWKGFLEARLREIEAQCGEEIDFVEDASLGKDDFAKSELAGEHGRTRHCVIYRPGITDGCHAYHLACQLEKLAIILEEKKAGRMRRFAMGSEMAGLFVEKTKPYMTDRFRASVPPGQMFEVLAMMMKGMGNQILNTPTDMIVSRRVFDRYPEMRPLQVAASLEIAQEGIGAVGIGIKSGMPKNLIRVSRVLNAVMLIWYKETFGLDVVAELPVPDEEAKLARTLCDDCRATLDAFKPGDEWDLVRLFLERLRCDSFYAVLNVVEKGEAATYEAESNRMFNERLESGDDPALKEALTNYMVEAIRRFRKLDAETVHLIAAEIAVKGRRGIDPDRRAGYTLQALGGEEMGGCQMLAYYYVAWRMTLPDDPEGTGLPLAKEYEAALARAGS